ncbi:MAG: Crp/Fnr family transcriptional regulator [Microscillaceae bacterium]|nr:Crp/Fnr family transcriptional regulator [Microscillaceae bacterium]
MKSLDLYQYLIAAKQYDGLESFVNILEFDKSDYIYQPGEKQHYIFLIEAGVVKIGSYDEEGQEVVYDVLTPGEIFGNLNYLENNFFEYARALCGCRLLVFRREFFKKIIVHDPKVSEWFNVTVVKRWYKAETRLLYMTRGNIEARLNNLIKELNQKVRDKEDKEVTAFDLLTYEDLANLAGTTRQTLSKKLKVGGL